MFKTALVTGASGFIGHHICNRLYNDNWKVIAIGNKNENLPLCHEFIQLQFNDLCWDLIPEIDVCFHQAANNDTTSTDLEDILRSNIIEPSILFYRLIEEKKCKQFVYASSCSIYGNEQVPYNEENTPLKPLNLYALSKKLFEEIAKQISVEMNVNLVGLRYSNVYGTGEYHKGKRSSMISQLLQKMRKGENPQLFKSGEHLRDWVYIEDVVEANLLASRYENTDVFNVGSGVAMNFNDVVKTLNSELKTSLEPEYIDCPFLNSYQAHTLLDLTKSNTQLGYVSKYEPKSGIKKLVEETIKAMI